MTSSYNSPEAFADLQLDLLAKERDAEADRTRDLLAAGQKADGRKAAELELRGLAIRKLVISEWKSGMYGRTVVVLTRQNGQPLPAANINNGDILGLFDYSSTEEVASGIVSSVTANALSLSFEENFDNDSLSTSENVLYTVVKLANDVTYRRLRRAIDNVKSAQEFSTLHNALLGTGVLSPPHQSLPPKLLDDNGNLVLVNKKLNPSQSEAIKFALQQRELAIIHGPPGTGKTTTIVELISQEVSQGNRVLCCAPSNVAVDNLVEKLANNRVRVVRLGHPARVQAGLQKHSLDAILCRSDQMSLVQDVRSDMDKTLSKLRKVRNKGERQGLRNELKQLRKELVEREKKATKETLSKAQVVLATLTSASEDGPLKHVPKHHFDVVVIDECSQALEAACWIALLHSKKAVLAGDHLQLPPTIMSEEAAAKGLAYTLMERILKTMDKNGDLVRMLTIQYRMHEKIMHWSSQAFYQGKLKAHSSVEHHLLKDLTGVPENENTLAPLVLIDTTGCDMYEVATDDEHSKANEGEAALVTLHAQQLIDSGLDPSDIAVITPYNLQVELIRLQLSHKFPTLEIRSVDGFQGREKEAVILSLVRSNPRGEVGFLSESRRLNVAVTRAKRHVVVIGNVETISSDSVLKGLTDYMETHGEVRSAMQYEHLVKNVTVVRPEGIELTLKDQGASCSKSESKPTEGKKGKPQNKAQVVKTKKNDEKHNDVPQVKSKGTKKPQEKDATDAVDRRQELNDIVAAFVASTDEVYNFSPELNSHDRMLVHEFAENQGLGHESKGEGNKRHIVLEKKEILDKETSVDKKETKTKVFMTMCCDCHKEMPRENIELHKLKCKVRVDNDKKGKVKVKKQKDQKEEEDIDKLLASFDKLDNVCNGQSCKAKIATLGVQCDHCRLRFCLGHGLPEAHGCGDAARKAARQQIARDGKLYPGSGRPNLKPDPDRKAQLQRRMDKKMGELQDDRKSKPKKK